VPGKAATDKEIVRDISEALKPWAPQKRRIESGKRKHEMRSASATEVLAGISETVRNEIAQLRTTTADFHNRSAIRKTRDDARDIIETVNRLEDQLSSPTLSPEVRVRLGHHTSLIGARGRDPGGAGIENMPLPRLLAALETVRAICQAAAANQPAADQVKLRCARLALRLILQFSDLKENKPSAGSNGANLCRIAGLLYEGVTGEREQSLRRVCQEVLRPYLKLLPS
jgi:hypothetical protein